MPLLTSEKLIADILRAEKLQDLMEPKQLKDEFKQMMKLIHPDVCGHPDAHTAVTKLNELRSHYIDGKLYHDESGKFRTNGEFLIYEGKEELLKISLRKYQLLMALRDEASLHFQRYLPKSMHLEKGKLHVELRERSVPLSEKRLPEHHVLWVLSRMLEFSGWIAQVGYVHAGLNPESVFVVPETHGIVITSFYHMTLKNTKLSTITARYRNWYPSKVFNEKRAISLIDVELCKKTAIQLLGDRSGSGVKLKKGHNKEFIDFVIAQDKDPYLAYQKYREMLKRNFKPKFHPLNW